jgi:hypothetical protein
VIEFNPEYELVADVNTVAEQTIQGIIDGSITIDLGQ